MPAVVCTGDCGDDRESESAAARGPIAPLVCSIQALEDALGLTTLYGIAATTISLVTFRNRDITS